MTPQLEEIRKQLEELAARAQSIAGGLNADRLMQRPAPKKWSVAECLEHLSMSSEPYFPIWERLFAEARAKGLTGNGPYRSDWPGRMLEWFLEPPPLMRFPAPLRFQPVELGPPEGVLPRFLSTQEQVIAKLSEGEGLALDKIKILSPFDPNGRFRYNAYSCFRILAAHQRRHLWQAERVLEKV